MSKTTDRPAGADGFHDRQARHVRQCLRELWVVSGVWLIAMLWCCGTLVGFGYIPPDQRPDVPSTIWGIPSWVFWGLFVPWSVVIVFTWCFALFWLKDDEPYSDFPDP